MSISRDVHRLRSCRFRSEDPLFTIGLHNWTSQLNFIVHQLSSLEAFILTLPYRPILAKVVGLSKPKYPPLKITGQGENNHHAK